jgi:hypothetical protein
MNEDKFSTNLLPEAWVQENPTDKAAKAIGNGSCFFNSVSLCLTGRFSSVLL